MPWEVLKCSEKSLSALWRLHTTAAPSAPALLYLYVGSLQLGSQVGADRAQHLHLVRVRRGVHFQVALWRDALDSATNDADLLVSFDWDGAMTRREMSANSGEPGITMEVD